MKLKCENLSKSFIRNRIFGNVSFELNPGDSLAVTGRNGSGKSTLVKIIAGLIKPDRGMVIIEDAGIPAGDEYFTLISLVAPYINLYDELTGKENLDFFYKLKSSFAKNNAGKKIQSRHPDSIDNLLNKTGLYEKRNEAVKNYSSGMKQRLKIAFALLNEPEILLMDEPGTNLDEEGKLLIREIAAEQNNNILIVATNDASESELCKSRLSIEDFKGS